MWKSAKARVVYTLTVCWIWVCHVCWATREWYRTFMKGPTAASEEAIERACRRVLAAHEARFGRFADQTAVTVRLMDRHERTVHCELTIPNYRRRPNLEHQGRAYAATRQDGAVWVYREQHH